MPNVKLSIIIVTYNAESFISFCIDSILRSDFNEAIEIVVVDNHSSDKSILLIEKEYEGIVIVENEDNLGFAKACNIGANESKGEFLVFLNPDCIVAEDSFQLLLDFYLKNDAGIVGPLLLNGQGEVLPESAREVPTNKAALVKLFKLPLQKNYPYYKHISANTPLESPVLTGACMLISRKVFDTIGRFDERFFMYGEDVDLSLQAIKTGLTNYCLPEAKVIHFKGESTDKSLFRNNENFYHSIVLYAEKHKSSLSENYKLKGLGIAVKVMSLFRFLSTFLRKSIPIILDYVIILVVFTCIQFIWSYLKSGSWFYYESFKYLPHYLGYGLIWVLSLTFQGAYYRESNRGDIFKGGIVGGALSILVYSLLPVEFRFSRGIMVIASLLIPVILLFMHQLIYILNKVQNVLVVPRNGKTLEEEKHFAQTNIVQLENVGSHTPLNITFDFNSISIKQMIDVMRNAHKKSSFSFWDRKRKIEFASNQSFTMGVSRAAYSHFNLMQNKYLLQKRAVDLFIIVLTFVPLVIFKISMLKFSFKSAYRVLVGRITLVGSTGKYYPESLGHYFPKSLLTCYQEGSTEEDKRVSTVNYLANYSIFDDLLIVFSNLKSLFKALINDD